MIWRDRASIRTGQGRRRGTWDCSSEGVNGQTEHARASGDVSREMRGKKMLETAKEKEKM